jgi:YidC/Oxa1 family membrane protein insertase
LDRNTLLAIALSLAVMVGWSMYQARFAPPPRETASEEASAPLAEEPTPAPAAVATPQPRELSAAPPPPSIAGGKEQTIRFEEPLYVAEFTTRGGGLLRWQLQTYDAGPTGDYAPIVMTMESDPVETTLLTPFPELGLGDLGQAIFEIESQDEAGVTFRYSRKGITLRKAYTLDGDSYSFRLRLEVENGSPSPVAPEFGVEWPATKSNTQDFKEEAFVVLHDGKVQRHRVASLGRPGLLGSIFKRGPVVEPEYSGEVDWAGIETTYFLGVLLPDNPALARAKIETVKAGDAGIADLSFPAVQLRSGQSTDQQFRAYLGPKEEKRLERMGSDTVRSINTGYQWIKPLVLGFSWLLFALYSIIPNYGVAIIVLTVMVRVVTMPLTNRQMRSMERMRAVQPKVKALQEKHGDDRQKQSEEMMKLYRAEGVNPLGGCFPMLLQLPVFIGLFYALRSSIHLRHAPFVGWINDLSAPETLFTIPGIEIPVRVLPLVMGVSMVVQQKITPTASADPAQARMMMTIMPVMMTVLFYQFPSGLVLYWFVSNVLAIAHQLLIGRRIRGGNATSTAGG